jgi:hypothetical protein
MARNLSLEREVLIFESTSATGNTKFRVPLSPQSVESVRAVQAAGTTELRLLELNTPMRGRLIFGTKHGDAQEILAKILEICRSKGIATDVTSEPAR